MLNIITRAKLQCEDDTIEGAIMGDYDSRMSALNASSNYNYTTKAEEHIKGDANITINRISYKGASGIEFDIAQDDDTPT